jgi:bacillolysin
MDSQLEVISASMDVVSVDGVNTQETTSAAEARAILSEMLEAQEPGQVPEPVKTIFPHPEEDGALHLAWHFKNVPLYPHQAGGEIEAGDDDDLDHGVCCGSSPLLEADFDYFIDAQNGELIYLFPNSAHIDIPSRCQGEDEDGLNQIFFGRMDGSDFIMENPFEDVRTMDLQMQPIETTAVPTDAISNGTNDWQNTNPAAVSAHVNATRVLDFLFRILRRDSIDDDGMELINIVNCASNDSSNPPEWINAMWYQNMMWYGQQRTGGGFRSLSSYLDIIAHELFHGVTSHTADLVYSGQPGALNESFSDIFGIIISNWHLAAAPGDVNTWTWDIGTGLGSGGNPMRNMADPSSVGRWRRPNPAGGGSQIVNGYPDHMNQYVALPLTQFYDWGGVHWFSNIHNFAAHKVLTSQRTDNSHVFSPEEVAILYYLVLTRLTRLSDFGDARTELLVVSDTIYAGNTTRSLEANAAITQAYDDVGIV